MLESITWQAFSILIAFLLFVYYVVILSMYYRKEVMQLLSGTFKQSNASVLKPSPAMSNSLTTNDNPSHLIGQKPLDKKQNSEPVAELHTHDALNQMLEELQGTIIRAGKLQSVKQELLQSIKGVIKAYPNLKTTDIIIAVNDFVCLQAENYCAIDLSEEEISPLWN